MLEVYTLEQKNEWDSVVRSFSSYDTYWLSGYAKAFFLHGDGEPLLFFYEKNGTRGINVVMKRDISQDKFFQGKIEPDTYFDFITPYGYGGWLIEGNDQKDLFSNYNQWCQNNGIVSEFVRFHPILKNHIKCEGVYDIDTCGQVVHMDLRSPEIIWENITSKNRNVIRKAIKNNVKIYNGRYPEIYEIFQSLYNVTMKKDGAKDYYYFESEFYQSLLEDLPENAQVFYAQVPDGTVIAAAIMLTANGKMNYHLSGSLREYGSLAAGNLLLYKAALWGYANGYRSFYLGGGVGSEEDNLFRFKRSFYKGDLNRFYIGKRIVNREKYQVLLDIRKEQSMTVQETEFFPLYRA